jgi:adenylate cyclase
VFKYIKRHKSAILSGLFISALIVFIQFSQQTDIQQLLARFDGIFYDIRLKASLDERQKTDQQILIIDIDQKSLAAEGRWPWSRIKIAKMVNKLAEHGVAVVAFDVLFAEPERNPVTAIANYYQVNQLPLPKEFIDIEQTLDADSIFSESLTEIDVVLGLLFQTQDKTNRGELPPSVINSDNIVNLNKMMSITYPKYESNIEVLQEKALGSGFINATVDPDGYIRRAALVIKHQGQFYPSLALEAARLLTFTEKVSIETVDIGNGQQQISGIRWGNDLIRTDAVGQVLIPYRGKRKSFPYVSATDVLNDNVPLGLLEGAVVFVGTSAVGIGDLKSTPVEVSFPGVEIHANVLEGILHPEIMSYQPDWWEAALALTIFFLATLCTFWFPAIGPLALTITIVIVMTVTTWFNFWLWQQHHISLMLPINLLLIFLIGIVNLGLGFFKENSQKKMIKGIFDQYVPPAHIDKILADPKAVNLDGERKEMTVLFSDIRSFTNISEKLTASELKKLLNNYFNPITKSIFEHQGTIDKYVGDMVMAFWGAPLNDAQHAQHALDTALDMLSITEKLRGEFKIQGLPEIYVGIGLNTGDMSVGDMGSEYRRAYTVLGDAVNLGARLESLTKFYGVECLVSQATKDQCPEHYFRFIDCVQVKGKSEAVKIYEPFDAKGNDISVFIAENQDYQQAYNCYLTQSWSEAMELFMRLTENHPGRKIYQIYIERITELSQQTLEMDWNGVFTHTSK